MAGVINYKRQATGYASKEELERVIAKAILSGIPFAKVIKGINSVYGKKEGYNMLVLLSTQHQENTLLKKAVDKLLEAYD